jgi:hypothetical protein
MGLGGLSEMLGMGVAIQLRNMFSVPAMAIERSSRAMTASIVGDQKTINNGFRMVAGGAALMLLGTGMFAGLAMLSKHILKSSNELEILRKQIRLLTHSDTVGDMLYGKLTKFAVDTPFTVDQVFGAAKNLLAFGFTSDRIMNQLRLTGEWAAMMRIPIDEAAAVIGKVRTGGIAMAMRRLQVAGISYSDVAKAGGPIDPKTQRTLKGADPEKFLAAVNKVIEAKFAGGMQQYMTTLPGMWSNFQDQLILASATIGDRFKPELKKMLEAVLSVFNPGLIQPFAQAIGDGLLVVLHGIQAVLLPLGMFITWMMQLSKEHPNFVKFGVVMLFAASALTTFAGAAMIAMGTFRILQYLWGAEKVAVFAESLLGLATPLGWLAVAATLFYVAWTNNFMGLRTVLLYFWSSATLVFDGVKQLLTSITSGVGQMSQSTYNSLRERGLLGLATELYMLFYRAYWFVVGLWDGIKAGIGILSFAGSVLVWLTAPIWAVVYGIYKIAEGLGWLGNLMGSDMWRAFGAIVGGIASAFIVAKVAMIAFNIVNAIGIGIVNLWDIAVVAHVAILRGWQIVTKTATAVQWAFNAALDANPIGLIIMAIGLVIVGVVLFITHLKQISAWFEKLPTWGKLIVSALFPMAAAAIIVYQHWDAIRKWFGTFGDWLLKLWDTVIQYLSDKITALLSWLKNIVMHVSDWIHGEGTDFGDSKGLTSEQKDQLVKDRITTPQQSPFARATQGGIVNQPHPVNHTQQPQQIHVTLNVDGKKMAKVVTMHQQNAMDSGGTGGSW